MTEQTKTIYQTNPDGAYVGQIILVAQISDTGEIKGNIDPLESKNSGHIVWQVPGGCVEVEPPAVPEGKVLYWRGGAWVLEDMPPEPEEEPEPEPTTEDKLNTLDANYNYQFSELVKALGLANLDNNTDLIIELQAEYNELKTQYQQEREAILNG